METWRDRMRAEMQAQGLSAAALDRRAFGDPEATGWRVRNWLAQRTGLPRDPAALEKVAEALGVLPLWLRDGVAPRRPGETTGDPTAAGDEIIMRRGFAERVADARKRRQFLTPEDACVGLAIAAPRWGQLEAGAASPTLTELRVISERRGISLDCLVSGRLTPLPER